MTPTPSPDAACHMIPRWAARTPRATAPAPGAIGRAATRRGLLALVALFGVFGASRGSSLAQPRPDTTPAALAVRGVVGGRSEAVAHRAPYLYLGVGPRLVVLDASDPTTPIEVGASPLLSREVTDLELAGDVAHVALESDSAGHTTVCTLGLVSPTAPEPLGCLDLGNRVWAIAAAGPVLYAAGNAGLAIVDVSDPSAPTRLAEVAFESVAVDVVASGDRVYVGLDRTTYRRQDGTTSDDSGYRVLEVSDPASPQDLGLLNELLVNRRRPVWRLAVRGPIAYALDDIGLSVYEVSNPSEATLLGRLDLLNGLRGTIASRLVVDGVRAWVVNAPYSASIAVVDVSDPAMPWLRSSVRPPTPSFRWNGAVPVGDRLALAYQLGGYTLLDDSDPAAPVLSTPYAPLGLAYHAAPHGNRLLVALPERGLGVVDVADAAAPALLSVAGVDATHVAVHGGHAYTVAPGSFAVAARLDVYDLTDPDRPVLVASLAPTPGAWGLVVDGGRLYVAGNALEIYDLADPAAPSLMGSTDLEQPGGEVAAANGFAYVSDAFGRLIAFDANDPTAPRETARLTLPDASTGLILDGGRLFVATHRRGLAVYDVTDPAMPTLDRHAPDLGWLRGVAARDGQVWVATWARIVAVDPADPADSTRWSTFDVPIVPHHLVWAADVLAVSGQGIALLGAASDPTPEPTLTVVATATPGSTPGATATATTGTDPAGRVGRVFLPVVAVDAPLEGAATPPDVR